MGTDIRSVFSLDWSKLVIFSMKFFEILESTVFHEGTHYGDVISDNLMDQTTASQEGGAVFEIGAYGKNLDASNAEAYVTSSRPDLVNRDRMADETKKNDELMGKGNHLPDKTRMAPTISPPVNLENE